MSAWYAVPFLGYITLVVFAVIRIVTALFLKETLASAANDADMQTLGEGEASSWTCTHLVFVSFFILFCFVFVFVSLWRGLFGLSFWLKSPAAHVILALPSSPVARIDEQRAMARDYRNKLEETGHELICFFLYVFFFFFFFFF